MLHIEKFFIIVLVYQVNFRSYTRLFTAGSAAQSVLLIQCGVALAVKGCFLPKDLGLLVIWIELDKKQQRVVH